MPDYVDYFKKAPFKKKEISNINKYQNLGIIHPLTCKNDHRKDNVLVPEEQGLVCPTCGYVQTWAPVCATNTLLINRLEELVKEYKKSCPPQKNSEEK